MESGVHQLSMFRAISNLTELRHKRELITSGVARAFPSGRLAHPESQNEEENK